MVVITENLKDENFSSRKSFQVNENLYSENNFIRRSRSRSKTENLNFSWFFNNQYFLESKTHSMYKVIHEFSSLEYFILESRNRATDLKFGIEVSMDWLKNCINIRIYFTLFHINLRFPNENTYFYFQNKNPV